MQAVSREAIEQTKTIFCTNNPEPSRSNNGHGQMDVEAYCNHYGKEVVKVKQHGTSTLYCLKECVFDPSQTVNESAIGITSEGKPFYQCFHNSCKDRKWKDAQEIISGKDSLEPFMSGKVHKTPITDRITEVTKDTPFEDVKSIIEDIAYLDTESEKAIHIQNLSEKTGIPNKTIYQDVKKARKDNIQVIDENVLIVHPSYEMNRNFMSLGFKETVVIGNKPTDRNIYLVSTIDGRFYCTNEAVYQIGTQRLIFHERDRVLISIGDKWDKKRFLAFINNSSKPQGIYETIKDVLRRYIEFQSEATYGLITAWIIGTYFHRCFNAFPFLYFYGKKQTGKSRALEILTQLSFHAFKNRGVSIPALADTIDGQRGTFLMDQAETLSQKDNVNLLGQLADSYTIGGGKRRIVNITNKVRNVLEFETYGPKAFASTKEIDTDLKDRCIEIDMLRAEREYPYPEAFLPVWGELRDKLYRLLLTRWKEVREIYQDAGQGVTQRIRELWRPLDTVLILEDVPDEERQTIKAFFLEAMLESQTGLTEYEESLVKALFDLLSGNNEGIFTVTEIVEKMNIPENEGFKKDAQRKWVGRALKKLSLFTEKLPKKDNRQNQYFFTREKIQKIIHRYEINGNNGINGNNAYFQASTDCRSKNDNGRERHNGSRSADELPFIADLENQTAVDKTLPINALADHAVKAVDSIENDFIHEEEEEIPDVEGERWNF